MYGFEQHLIVLKNGNSVPEIFRRFFRRFLDFQKSSRTMKIRDIYYGKSYSNLHVFPLKNLRKYLRKISGTGLPFFSAIKCYSKPYRYTLFYNSKFRKSKSLIDLKKHPPLHALSCRVCISLSLTPASENIDLVVRTATGIENSSPEMRIQGGLSEK